MAAQKEDFTEFFVAERFEGGILWNSDTTTTTKILGGLSQDLPPPKKTRKLATHENLTHRELLT